MTAEWDDDVASLASHARFCDHDYRDGFCRKCGWKKGSHRSFETELGAGPDDDAPVLPPLPDDVENAGLASQDPELEEDLELFDHTGKEEPR